MGIFFFKKSRNYQMAKENDVADNPGMKMPLFKLKKRSR